jgi:hypothetical protein
MEKHTVAIAGEGNKMKLSMVGYKSLEKELLSVPSLMDSVGNDDRYFQRTLEGMGFEKRNDFYYRLILDVKGKRVSLNVKIYGDNFYIYRGIKRIGEGIIKDHKRFFERGGGLFVRV